MVIYKSTTPEIKLRLKSGQMPKIKINSSDDASKFFREIFDQETLEVFEQVMVLYLNNSRNTVGWVKISSGGITGTVIDTRLIFKGAFECCATGIIICHNHPSGTLERSQADNDITEKLKQGGQFLDIIIVDHIILTKESYFSFADNGVL